MDAVSPNNESLLNRYCVDAVCHNSMVNSSIFAPEDCNSSLCVSEVLTPSQPDIGDHSHWFFTYALYIGGGIHLVASLLMLIFYLILNTPDFQPPLFERYYYNLRLYVATCLRNESNYIICFKCRFLLNKDEPVDHFEQQKPPKYFRIRFRTACVQLGYVFVSNILHV